MCFRSSSFIDDLTIEVRPYICILRGLQNGVAVISSNDVKNQVFSCRYGTNL